MPIWDILGSGALTPGTVASTLPHAVIIIPTSDGFISNAALRAGREKLDSDISGKAALN